MIILSGSVAAAALISLQPTLALAATAQDDSALAELVITATRREDTVNRVPLSVTALSQQSLETQTVRSIDDIRRLTPGLGLSYGNPGSGGGTETNISLRGIASNGGAATTGVYLDDIPLQKTGSSGNGYGAPYPKLFDIDRIEVLRGPQGTLYGGSTEGGAIRFITPAPSLTTFSGHARGEVSSTKQGEASYEAGVAVGGPIVQDRLGFRLSGWFRRDGGYVDHVSRFTGKTLAEDTNRVDSNTVRAAVTFSPVAAARITASVLVQKERRDDQDLFWEDIPAINAPAVGFLPNGQNCTTVPVTACARVIPATTYGPYDMFGPYKSGSQTYNQATGAEAALLSPRLETLYVPSLTVDYDFGNVTFKSISGYVSNKVKGSVDFSYNLAPTFLPTYPANEIAPFRGYMQIVPFINNRRQISQEFRLASTDNGSRLSWVGGVYFTNSQFNYTQQIVWNQAEAIPAIRGVSAQTFFGFTFPGAPQIGGIGATILIENALAAYGDATYAVTDKLKLTGGLRISRDEVTLRAIGYGLNNQGAAVRGDFTATAANGGLFEGSTQASTLTPKAGLSYEFEQGRMVYATVAKGYRPGGFNSPAQSNNAFCQNALSQLGTSIPSTFENDTVWSYEAGSKLRMLDGRVQLNSSVYRIDWTNIQALLSLPNCGTFTTNAAEARSQGFDIQGEFRVARGLTLSGTVGHTDAKYRGQVSTPTLNPAVRSVVVNDGDPIPGVPAWSFTLGAEYDFAVANNTNAYIRGDYSYATGLYRSTGPGTTGYLATIYKSPNIEVANVRAGLRLANGVDVSLFAKNVFNSQDRVYEQGGSTVLRNSPIVFAQTFRPREIGLTASYRY